MPNLSQPNPTPQVDGTPCTDHMFCRFRVCLDLNLTLLFCPMWTSYIYGPLAASLVLSARSFTGTSAEITRSKSATPTFADRTSSTKGRWLQTARFQCRRYHLPNPFKFGNFQLIFVLVGFLFNCTTTIRHLLSKAPE